jgi:putative SOS response-associated peptidase YedK
MPDTLSVVADSAFGYNPSELGGATTMCYSALVKRDLDYLGRKYGAVIIREQIEDYRRASAADLKRFPPPEPRIFPGHYAPVIFEQEGKLVVELQRYGAYPPPQVKNPKAYTTFNARRDNLTSNFWSGAFMHHHGFVVLEGFYEWVGVKDLLKAGVVTLKDVEAEFAKQAEERKAKVLATGKKYKPTPIEQKDPRMRQIIIEFKPEDGQEMLAPVIFSYGKDGLGGAGKWDAGFAIVTDDPPFEIEQAGHDRCPVILEPEALKEWLYFAGAMPEELIQLLGKKKRVTFKHKLAEAA